MIAASGMPRAAAAVRMRARRVETGAVRSADTFAGVARAVESALPDITAISESPGLHVSCWIVGSVGGGWLVSSHVSCLASPVLMGFVDLAEERCLAL